MLGLSRESKKRQLWSFAYISFCFFLSVLIIFLSRNVAGFSDWYVIHIYPLFPSLVGRVSSLLPFSIFEFGIYVMILLTGFVLFRLLWLGLFRKNQWKSHRKKTLIPFLCLFGSFLLLFILTCAVNYSRSEFAVSTGMPVQKSSKDELVSLSRLLMNDLDLLISKNDFNFEEAGSSRDWVNKTAIDAMKHLGSTYPSLSGYYPDPKPVTFSKPLSYLGIRGIYSPLTVEANYSTDLSPVDIPYTISHELSHLKGYMKEEDAGFIAYLACKNSSSPYFQYSGTVNALIFVLNALQEEVDEEEFMEIYAQIPDQAKTDIKINWIYSEQDSTFLNSLAKTTNQLYLYANAETNGIKSYGMMVDLLLAEYADEIKSNRNVI